MFLISVITYKQLQHFYSSSYYYGDQVKEHETD
jgi:hypothetical protein